MPRFKRVLLAGLFTVSAATAGPSESHRVDKAGLGFNTCETFLKDIAAKHGRAESEYFIWAQGFMSGMNRDALPHDYYLDLNSRSVAEQKAAIRSYCAEYPHFDYSTAVYHMYMSLNMVPQKYAK